MSFILSPLSYSFILSLLSDISFIFVSSALICCLLYLTLFFYSVSFCLLSVVSCCLCSFAVSSIRFSFLFCCLSLCCRAVVSLIFSYSLLCVVFVSSLFFLSPASFCLLHFVLHLHASAAAAAAAAAVAAGVVSVDLTIVGSLP